MRKSRFTKAQILAVLDDGEAGLPVAEVCRKHGISAPTYSVWKSKFAGMSRDEVRRMYAELALKNAAIKDVLSQKL